MFHLPALSVKTLTATHPEPEFIPGKPAYWIVVQGQKVLVIPGPVFSAVMVREPASEGLVTEGFLYLGMRGQVPCYATELAHNAILPGGWSLFGARELFGKVPDEEVALAAYAIRILDYDRSTRFCGRCGRKTRALRTERARLCTDCNRIVYPRICPAIIVLVRKGDTILLARSSRFVAGQFSVIAGFVEPGENLEEAVHREVREEVGLTVANIRYFGSEPWPFPDSLMIGFVADHAGGEIVVDNNEIESAAWFGRDNLPLLPSSMSIARALIDAWHRGDL
jgi:NAD+ diphosphatase